VFRVGQFFRPLLPARSNAKCPSRLLATRLAGAAPRTQDAAVLDGCVQPSLRPTFNPANGACAWTGWDFADKSRIGGLLRRRDLPFEPPGRRAPLHAQNIDAWWPHIEAGAENVVMTRAACGTMVKEYGPVLARDPAYAKKRSGYRS